MFASLQKLEQYKKAAQQMAAVIGDFMRYPEFAKRFLQLELAHSNRRYALFLDQQIFFVPNTMALIGDRETIRRLFCILVNIASLISFATIKKKIKIKRQKMKKL